MFGLPTILSGKNYRKMECADKNEVVLSFPAKRFYSFAPIYRGKMQEPLLIMKPLKNLGPKQRN